MSKVSAFVRGLGRTVGLLGKGANSLGALLIAGMMVITCSEVVSRGLFNNSIDWSVDVVAFCVGAVAFLGIAYTQAQKRHIGMVLVITHLPRVTQRILAIFGTLVSLGLFSALAWQGWEYAFSRRHATTEFPALLPLFPSVMLVAVGAFLIFLQLVVDLCQEIRSHKAVEPDSSGVL